MFRIGTRSFESFPANSTSCCLNSDLTGGNINVKKLKQYL